MTITLALFADFGDAPRPATATWDQLVAMLGRSTEVECPPCTPTPAKCERKYGTAWSPVELVDGATTRGNANVVAVTCAVFDLDHLTDEQVLETARALAPYTYVAHSTHNHEPPANNCLRVVVPLSRPVPAAEWLRVYRAARKALGLGALLDDLKDLARIYFLPRVKRGMPFIHEVNVGRELDVDELLRASQEEALAAPPPPPAPPLINAGVRGREEEAANDLEVARKLLRATAVAKARSAQKKNAKPEQRERDTHHAELLDRVVKGEALSGPGGRDVALQALVSLLANVLNPLTAWELVAELLRASLSVMSVPEDAERGLTPLQVWFEEAADMWRRALERRADHERKSKEDRERTIGGFREWLQEQNLGAREKSDDEQDPGTAALAVSRTPPDWHEWLQLDKEGGWKSSGHNTALVLEHDAPVAGSLRWNEVTRDIEVVGGLFANTPAAVLDVRVTDWLCYEWNITMRTHDVGARILSVARKRSYDPVKDYLRSLRWDGETRVDGWLEKFCAVETTNEGRDVARHVRAFARRFLIAAVARALRPGCKVDTVLILEGAQGLKKSTAFDVLFSPWFADERVVLGDKDSKLLAARTWCLEMPELANFRRSDDESRKQFFAQRRDAFRPPYGRVIEAFPRRCVFVGTMNPRDGVGYLTDPTGNRRYWPVRCSAETDARALAAARDQLFAEAVVLLDAAAGCAACQAGPADRCAEHRWWFERGEALEVETDVTESRVSVVDEFEAVTEAIRDWVHSQAKKPEEFSAAYIATAVLQMDAAKVTHAELTRVGMALARLRFRRVRVSREGHRDRMYQIPDKRPGANAADPRGPIDIRLGMKTVKD